MNQLAKHSETINSIAPVMLVTGGAKRIGAAIIRAAHRHCICLKWLNRRDIS